MTRPMAAWRTTYTPGRWLALTGPNTLVVMAPPPARAAATVNELWRSVVEAGSLDALLKLVSDVGLDAMPDLGAFHWDDDGLHGIARGRVQVVDTDTSDIVLDGEGSVTWREEHLGRERNLGITLEEFDPEEALQLPLVIGAASISALFLTTNPAALVNFPAAEAQGDEAGDMAAPAVDFAQSPAEGDDAFDVPAPGEDNPYEAFGDEEGQGDGFDAFSGGSLETPHDDAAHWVADESEQPQAEEYGQPLTATSPEEAPVGEFSEDLNLDDAPPADEFRAEAEQNQEAASQDEPYSPGLAGVPAGLPGVPPLAPEVDLPQDEPVSMSSPGAERSDPIVIPPNLGEVEDDGGTIFSTGLAATHKPAPPSEERQDPQVLAVPCTNGHANAPGSRTCRICQYPVDSSNPRLIRRPLLAGVHTNRGDFADVVAGVIVGRAPDASKGPAGSYLMRVVSPGNDISRNHVLITTRDWNVHVTDLNSTNGTTVLPDGEPPFTLRDGASVQVGIGTVLDLGDGVSLRIEPPRG